MAEQADFKLLFTPLKIGAMEVRNRIVSTAVGQGQYAISRAKGGIGLVITGSLPVHRSCAQGMGGIWDDSCIAPFKAVTDEVHKYGAKYVAQLNHTGRNTYGMAPLHAIWSASNVVNRQAVHGETPHEMTIEEIQEVVQAFADAAVRMRSAGLDGVEIHASHDYLIQQFMSPLSNHRTDEYGGSEDNRVRFGKEVIAAVRKAVGTDYTVGIRVDVDQFEAGGLGVEDMQRITGKLLESNELDYVSATFHLGSNETFGQVGVSIPTMYVEPGKFTYLSAAIKQITDLPVFAVGRINNPIMAEQVLQNNEADMIAMMRAMLADPELPNKAREGRLDEIRYCIGCNEGCLNSRSVSTCAVNPAAGRELETEIIPASVSKRVMVIGGGIAGMEAARVAALRGHQVTLYEKEPVLGGQLQIASKAPGRSDFMEPIRYYTRQFELLEVPVKLGVEVNEELVKRENPDAVIVATGGVPATPPIQEGLSDGNAGVNVVYARDVLAGAAEVTGNKVAIFATDQDMESLTTADYLADRGLEVQILIPFPDIASKTEAMVTKPQIINRLLNKGVKINIMTAVKALRNGQIIAHHPPNGPEWPLESVQTLVLAAGSVQNDGLWRSLRNEVNEIYYVGECVSPRRLMRSTLDGLQVGLQV